MHFLGLLLMLVISWCIIVMYCLSRQASGINPAKEMKMASESKAEEIVWKHFLQFVPSISLERKGTDRPRVKKLLSSASKRGSGNPGFPDFIITHTEHPDFLIVIECKADIARHESPERDNWQDYAVDGVLFYADHLCQEFDVLAIAFSGTSKSRSKVSHFLQLRQGMPQPIFGNNLLASKDYIRGYYNKPEKVDQCYESLRNFAKSMNSKLHSSQVSSKNRALLIASIMMALESDGFKKSYMSENDSTLLAELIYVHGSRELSDVYANYGQDQKLSENFNIAISQIPLLKKHNELQSIVKSVDSEINTLTKNQNFTDVLGELYVEFLRYANSDKALGIVLTPRHITDFFVEIANVDKNSIVYDNCAGTGGFLISAMRQMINDAAGDVKKEKNIKQKQLFGVEIQSDIFALLLANMHVHQDGKASMIFGNCFEADVYEQMKAQRPTVGLLNPPYRADKQKDCYELEFVQKNLDCLQTGGVCVALLPMSCAVSRTAETKKLREELMENHTLEAVISLPDDLFFDAKVKVVTCAMVFRAHQRHPKGKQVFLGYYKDDGFTKSKIDGRTDSRGKWKNIKKKWVDSYLNKAEIPGFSTKVELHHEMDWSPEHYMVTDYTSVNDDLFIETILSYSSYLFSEKIISLASSESKIKTAQKLPPTEEWEKYKLTDYFEIKGTKTTLQPEIEQNGEN